MEVDNDVLFPFGPVITHQRTIIGILVKLIITYGWKKKRGSKLLVLKVHDYSHIPHKRVLRSVAGIVVYVSLFSGYS